MPRLCQAGDHSSLKQVPLVSTVAGPYRQRPLQDVGMSRLRNGSPPVK